jgi:hypothetical protein
MHGTNRCQSPSRNRRRRALEVLAVVAGGCGVYHLVRRLRARQQAVKTVLPPAGTLLPVSSVVAPDAAPSLGEHSVWLETFRAEQVQRLRSDPPAA